MAFKYIENKLTGHVKSLLKINCYCGYSLFTTKIDIFPVNVPNIEGTQLGTAIIGMAWLWQHSVFMACVAKETENVSGHPLGTLEFCSQSSTR
ncbi:MAG: hypothetical protein NWE95_06515 [Candidatus Bathyarchaeota archaeon]|nr:hypothetical protein [Candidatus Bathyarchaeota archaeon]